MTKRPIGIIALCIGIGFLGVGQIITGISLLSGLDTVPSGIAASLRAFVYLMPLLFVLWGITGTVAAILLWKGNPLGRTTGVTWAALWTATELFILLWARFGPELVREASPPETTILLRIGLAVLLAIYLMSDRTVRYVHSSAG